MKRITSSCIPLLHALDFRQPHISPIIYDFVSGGKQGQWHMNGLNRPARIISRWLQRPSFHKTITAKIMLNQAVVTEPLAKAVVVLRHPPFVPAFGTGARRRRSCGRTG